MSRALIVVDIQNDFCEGGALAVAGGNNIAEGIAKYIEESADYYQLNLFTQDWHNAPPDTNGGHFDEWPVHCVAGTEGAELHPAVADFPYKEVEWEVFKKGQGKPDYSGFQGVNELGSTLDQILKSAGIDEVHICGLAGDYCVKETALDAVRLGYQTLILPSLVASVSGDSGTYRAVRDVTWAQMGLDSNGKAVVE